MQNSINKSSEIFSNLSANIVGMYVYTFRN